MRIPLPKMMRHWREREYEQGLSPAPFRAGLKLWAFFAKRPRLYRFGANLAAGLLGRLSGGTGRFTKLPLAQGWTGGRDLPAPEGKSFMQQWQQRQREAA